MKYKRLLKVETEFTGNIRFLNRLINDNKIQFKVYSKDDKILKILSSNIIKNEDGEIYSLIDRNIEQGRRHLIEIRFEIEVEMVQADKLINNYIGYTAIITSKKYCFFNTITIVDNILKDIDIIV